MNIISENRYHQRNQYPYVKIEKTLSEELDRKNISDADHLRYLRLAQKVEDKNELSLNYSEMMKVVKISNRTEFAVFLKRMITGYGLIEKTSRQGEKGQYRLTLGVYVGYRNKTTLNVAVPNDGTPPRIESELNFNTGNSNNKYINNNMNNNNYSEPVLIHNQAVVAPKNNFLILRAKKYLSGEHQKVVDNYIQFRIKSGTVKNPGSYEFSVLKNVIEDKSCLERMLEDLKAHAKQQQQAQEKQTRNLAAQKAQLQQEQVQQQRKIELDNFIKHQLPQLAPAIQESLRAQALQNLDIGLNIQHPERFVLAEMFQVWQEQTHSLRI